MSSSREDSPDWLREFKAPTVSVMALSSDSDRSLDASPSKDSAVNSQMEEGDDETPAKLQKRKKKRKNTEGDEDDGQVAETVLSEKHTKTSAADQSVWTLSSDSETEKCLPNEDELDGDAVLVGSSRSRKSQLKKVLKDKSRKKRVKKEELTPKKERKSNGEMQMTGDNGLETELLEEPTSEKHIGPQVSSSRLPLLISDKVQRLKALVECEGDSIDLSGDVGAVGRVVIQDNAAGNNEMYLDLKGTIYKTTIASSRTFCIVNFGQTEAKIEAIMDDFIQLKPQSNVNEVETMVEGTLDFSFDSEDEADKMSKHLADKDEGPGEQPNRKTKKSSGSAQKKGKAAGKSQPAKKVRKKTQAPKKGKTKK